MNLSVCLSVSHIETDCKFECSVLNTDKVTGNIETATSFVEIQGKLCFKLNIAKFQKQHSKAV